MIVKTMQDIAKKMKIDFEGTTKQIKHNGVKGDTREYLLSDFLKKYLPQKYNLETGIIMNHEGVQSKQQDIIIYDAFSCPLLYNTDKQKVVPIESIFSTIEVKSCLNKEQLKDCIEKIKSVREMHKTSTNNTSASGVKIMKSLGQVAQTAGLVFAFTSDTSLETLMSNLQELNNDIEYNHRISAICVLDKGTIVNVSKNDLSNIESLPTQSSVLAVTQNDDDNNLLFFYLFLIGLLNQLIINPPDLFEYTRNSGFKLLLNIPKEMIPKGSRLKIPNIGEVDIDIANEVMHENEIITERFKTVQDLTFPNLIEYFEYIIKASNFASQTMNSKNVIVKGLFNIEYNTDVLMRVVEIYRKIMQNAPYCDEDRTFFENYFTELIKKIRVELQKDL